jgi:ABC-type amino acid transport system permease subunit
MMQMGQIVSVIAIIACLVLALRNSEVRSMGSGKAIRMAALWAAIIIGLVLVIQVSGFRIAS